MNSNGASCGQAQIWRSPGEGGNLQSAPQRGVVRFGVSSVEDLTRFESGFAWASIAAGHLGVGAMSDHGEKMPPESGSPPPSDRLDSWKEIAAYLRRSVTTVQRWEKEEGLPTHRLHHGKLGSVYAFKMELDVWLRARRERIPVESEVPSPENGPIPNAPPDAPAAPSPVEPATIAPQEPAAPVSHAEAPQGRRLLAPGLAFAGVSVAGLILAVSRFVFAPAPVASPGPPRTFPITSSRGLERHPAISPDGRRLAYVSNDAGETFDLYVKDVDSPSALRLTASPSSECCPAWSPDQRTIAFLRLVGNEALLLTMPATGGAEERQTDLTPWFGSALSFSPDGRFLAYSDRGPSGGPFLVKLLELATGEIRTLTKADPASSGDAFAKFSPDGGQIAFARLSASRDVAMADLYVVPVKGGEPRRLTHNDRFVGDLDWTPDGRELLFVSDRTGALRFWRVAVTGGDPALVWPGGDPSPANTFAEGLIDVSHAFRFSAARSSSRLALTQRAYDTNIFRLDPRSPGTDSPPFIGSSQVDESPQVSPDGRHIALSSMRSGEQAIWICYSDGSACGLLARTINGGTPRWAPDSQSVVFDGWSPGSTHADIFTIDIRTLAVRRVTDHDADDVVPSFSRDGQSIYFASNRTGDWQVFRTSVGGGPAQQVTHEGGFAAFEAPSGDPILYSRFNLPGLYRVPRGGGEEKPWLDRPRCWGHWAVAPDGVYLLDSREGQKTRLEFVGFGEDEPRVVATLPQRPPCAESSLASSPDGAFLLWVGIEESSDIARVDDLR